MPITIKSTELKYKNPSTGQYQGIDAVAETTTSQQCALIEAKGAETIASIPNDYTTLSNAVNDEIAERKTYARPNLLDNWYFVGGGSQQGKDYFPINQRGGTSKSSSGYWIDRWYMNIQSGATFSIESNGFKILKTAGTNIPGISQTFEANLDGKQITLSILDSDNNLLTATATVNSSTSGWQISKSNTIWWMGFRFNNSRWDLSITSSSVILVAAKIEIGGNQTLCHNTGTESSPVWVLNEVPNYATELYKCQRYLQKSEGNWDLLRLAKYASDTLIFELPLPVQLRAAPDLSSYLNNQIRVYPVGGWTQVTGFTAIATGVTHSGLRLTLTKSSHGLTDCDLQINNGVFYSAEP